MSRAQTATMAVAVLRGRKGMWRLEYQCGQCGSGGHVGKLEAVQSEKRVKAAIERYQLCDGVYMGKPGNKCRWPLSFAWVFVPLTGAPS